MATKRRRRFTADFKKRAALLARRSIWRTGLSMATEKLHTFWSAPLRVDSVRPRS